MGFLDRMLADMIADSTGLPVRRIVRRVGARNLLLLGGAALAGGALVHAANRDRSAPGAPPPPPAEPPTQVPPPPPPPRSTGAPPPLPPPVIPPHAPSDDLPPGLAFAVVRAMVGAALADGELSNAERGAIHEHLADSGLGAEQVAQIHRDLVLPASPDEIAALARDADERLAVYRAAVLVVHADREVTAHERAWLERLASALRLDPEARDHVLPELESLA